MTVSEWWYGQGDEVGGLHRRTRQHPLCEMVVGIGRSCDRPAVERVTTRGRYPSSKYWCGEHAIVLRTDVV